MKRIAGLLVSVSLLSMTFLSVTFAQEYTLLAGHQLAAGTPFDQGLIRFAELVEEKTDGQVVVEVNSGGAIGSELEMFEGMTVGTVDAAVVAPNSIAEFVPEATILSMPFLVDSREMRDRVIESDAFQRVADLIQEQAGVEVLGVFGGGVRNMFFTEPVENAEGMQGRRFRVQPSRILTDSFGALGLEPTVVAYSELYNALAQGVVSGAENESVYVLSQAFYEPAPYLLKTQHEVTIRPLVMSSMTLDGMPPELADAVREAGAEASEYARQVEAEADDAALQELQDEHGMTVVEIDTAPLIAEVEPIWAQYAEGWGLTDVLEQITALR